MPMLKRRTSREAEIPTASMADIAFLLLIFFLVTTTIDVDTGIYMELPPKLETDPPEIPDRNILTVLVNAQGDVLIEGEYRQMRDIRPIVKEFVTNEGRNPEYSDSPDEGVVSFKTERASRYESYITVLDEIRMAYQEIRDEYARQLGAPNYETYEQRLPEGAEDQVAERYKVRISIAEPDPGTGPAAAPAAGS